MELTYGETVVTACGEKSRWGGHAITFPEPKLTQNQILYAKCTMEKYDFQAKITDRD